VHDLGIWLIGMCRSIAAAVLCGVEALPAQRWAVGAISLCAVYFARGGQWDFGPEWILRSRFGSARTL